MEENKDINAVIGKNLLNLRKNKKLTQLEVAEKFNYSDKSISKWEKGESMPSVEVLCELAAFYEVSLDDLTKDSTEILPKVDSTKAKKEPKVHTPRAFPTRLVVTLLSVGAVWLIATIIFVLLKMFAFVDYLLIFMWASVASCIVLIIFNSLWGKMRYLFIVLTALLWLSLTTIHLQIHIPTGYDTYPIFILGIPLQILIFLWAALVKKPKGYDKKQKAENTTEEIK